MIDLSHVVIDPRFAQSFTVLRTTGEWLPNGEFNISQPEEIKMVGTISIASAKQIEFIPEGDRVGGEIVIHCVKELYTSRNNDSENSQKSGIADIVVWHKEKYKVLQVSPYSDYGYFSAIAQRMVSD